PVENHSVWRLFYFISFLLLVAFFVLNMFVGVVVENFHRCREQQEKEEKARRAAKRAKKLEKKRKKLMEPPYYINYSKPRLFTKLILKLLKMAKGIRALLDTVMQALPQVGNLGLLFFLLFFIFAALGVELFGRLECTEEFPCEGLGEHAHFRNFGMAFLTLFRVATGDNWNGIMKDTLRESCDSSSDCVRNCCVSAFIAPLYFVVFVLMAQFVLVNVVVAVLMKHLEESHKHMEDDLEMDAEIEQELAAEQEQKLREVAAAESLLEVMDREETNINQRLHKPIVKMASLPANFTFTFNNGWDNEKDY
ncbi:voltage-dependent T-type calcium channel subunit alpha-1G-like, partial [Centruroides sculpturatus]|uniref:voltage-dependent T-type calcium channel subunit alpha-1G-like n=1 Tax=Centruroides sculpturatus TaxID=218467 RepID=UPI000C6CC7FF